MKMRSLTAMIGVLVALGSCSSFNSAYSPQIDDTTMLRGAELTVYPFLVTTEAYDDVRTASIDVTYAFANEIIERGTAEVVVAEYVFPSSEQEEIDPADESSEDSLSSDEDVEPKLVATVFTERDLLEYAEGSEDEFFVLGLVEQYNLLEVEYSVFVYRRSDMRIVAQAGGLRRIPWYNVNRSKHLRLLTVRVVDSLGL